MLNKFWESIGSNVAERWLDHILGPAFLFWGGGLGLYAWRMGWQQVLRDFQAFTPFQQGNWILLALFALVFSSVLMQSLRFPILRLLEGYWPWPLRYLGAGIVALRKPSFEKKYDELRLLKVSEVEGNLDPGQKTKLNRLEAWAHRYPVKPDDLLPTGLGNILRAREYSPERKYGLNAIICWPRLWPLLPENTRTDLENARATLDRLAELCFWGFLFLFWAYLSYWAIVIGLLWMAMSYGMAQQAALAYGDLLESAFDLYRFSLYDAMGWPRPKNSSEETELGNQLTEYLWRGTVPKKITYQMNNK